MLCLVCQACELLLAIVRNGLRLLTWRLASASSQLTKTSLIVELELRDRRRSSSAYSTFFPFCRTGSKAKFLDLGKKS